MNSDTTNVQVGFTLSDLRTMHAQGKLSSEELKRAEEQMIKRVRADAPNSEAIRIRAAAKQDSGSKGQESSPEDAE